MTRKKKALFYVILPLLLALAALRLALPSLLKWYVNKTLSSLPGYDGHVDDIDVALLRGAYQIQGLSIVKTSGKAPAPFVAAEMVDLSIEWKELFRGALVGEIAARRLELNFVKGRNAAESQTGLEEAADKTGSALDRHQSAARDWRDVVTRLFPLRINHFEIHDGAVHFKDLSARPPLDIYLSRVEARADNLTNSRKAAESQPAALQLRAKAMDQGDVALGLKFNPFDAEPNFDLNAELKGLNLVTMNGFLRHYVGFDARKGRLDIYAEVAANQGRIKGYVKPLIEDFDVVSLKKDPLTFKTLQKVFIEWIGRFFENNRTDKIATKVEFEGPIDEPESSAWSTIKSAFRNAFIKAISPRLDEDVGRQ
jgi:hypothetical protein